MEEETKDEQNGWGGPEAGTNINQYPKQGTWVEAGDSPGQSVHRTVRTVSELSCMWDSGKEGSAGAERPVAPKSQTS